MNRWATSDLHFGHKNVIKYCNRPFKDTFEMEQALIENWNRVVGDDDEVYFLGDMFFCGKQIAAKITSRLKGKIIFIRGNHDWPTKKLVDMGFRSVQDKYAVQIGKHFVNMSHYPYAPNFAKYGLNQEDVSKVVRGFNPYNSDGREALDHELFSALSAEQKAEINLYDMRYFDRRIPNNGHWLLCGHVHEKWKIKERMINVGCDVWNYTPVHFDELQAIMDKSC